MKKTIFCDVNGFKFSIDVSELKDLLESCNLTLGFCIDLISQDSDDKILII